MEGRALRYVAAAAIAVAVAVVVVLSFVVPSGDALSVGQVEVAPEIPGNVDATCQPVQCTSPPANPEDYLISFLVTGSRHGTVRCTVTVTRHGQRLAEKTAITDTARAQLGGSWYDS
ncbi:MAG TPA: hypothetical protein VKR22_07990, partial [Acidimicrobiales bacterium]|nr:hypothetical protein [Acidimicrobiales bacterium]